MTAPVISEPKPGDARDSGDAGKKIDMTAPVFFEQTSEAAWVYRFVLPGDYSIDTAPRPTNPDISLAQLPSRRVAVYRYSGRTSVEARREATGILRDWIAMQDLEERSEPRYAGYDPPWTLPPFRRHEVLIDVAGR